MAIPFETDDARPVADADRVIADACHLCYETRWHLRQRYPEELAPGQVYGVI